MMMSAPPGPGQNRFRKLCFATAVLLAGVLATEMALVALMSDSAVADPGGKGGGNGGGNGGGGNGGGNGGGGNGGGNSGGGNSGGGNSGGGNSGGGNSGGGNSGGGNSGGGSGNSNSGGNGGVNGNGGINGNAGVGSSSPTTATEIADPNSVRGLRETGQIQSLDSVYDRAEQELDGEVIGAKLMVDERQRLTYDLRVVTEDGHVRRARYDAGTLALLSLDDQPVE